MADGGAAGANPWFNGLDYTEATLPTPAQALARGMPVGSGIACTDSGAVRTLIVVAGVPTWSLGSGGGGAPTGPASGDLGGVYPSPTLNPSTGTGGAYGKTDATSAATTDVLTVRHLLAGEASAAQGFGIGLRFDGPDDGGTVQPYAEIAPTLETRAGSFFASLRLRVAYGAIGAASLFDMVQITDVGELRVGIPPGTARVSAIGPALSSSGVTISEAATYGLFDGGGVRHVALSLTAGTTLVLGDTNGGTQLNSGADLTNSIPAHTGVNAAPFGNVRFRGGIGTGNAAPSFTAIGGSSPMPSGATPQLPNDSLKAFGDAVQHLGGFGRPRRAIPDVDTTALARDQRIAYTSLTVARTVTGFDTSSAGLSPGVLSELVIADESGNASPTKTLTFAPASGTIDGVASKVVVSSPRGEAVVYFDGANWHSRQPALAATAIGAAGASTAYSGGTNVAGATESLSTDVVLSATLTEHEIDTTGGVRTESLPSAAALWDVHVVADAKGNFGVNKCTVNVQGGGSINGAPSIDLVTAWSERRFKKIGATAWRCGQ